MTIDKEIEAKQQEVFSLWSVYAMIKDNRQSETADALLAFVQHEVLDPYAKGSSFSKERILERKEATITHLNKLLEAYDVIWDAMIAGQKLLEIGAIQKPKKKFGLF